MPCYRAYGLGIESEFPLPVPPAGGTDSADVRIRMDCLEEVRRELCTRPGGLRVSATEAGIRWGPDGVEAATFVIREGKEILVDPVPGVDESSVRLGILGPAIAALLQQRGRLLLHASVVGMRGAAIAFLGSTGSGKSTLAAAFHATGCPLVADDIAAIGFETGNPVVFSAIPQFKLWPDSVTALGERPDSLPLVEPASDKRAMPIQEGFWSDGPLPLRRIYVLSTGDTPGLEPLTPREAFMQIAAHSYGISWLHEAFGPLHFAQRAELANRIPVRRLRRTWSLDHIADSIGVVEEDLASEP